MFPLIKAVDSTSPLTSAQTLCDEGRKLRKEGRLEAARDAFLSAAGQQPDLPDIFHELGATYSEMKRTGDAKAAYQKALAIKPDYVEALNNLGVVCQEMEEFGEATRCLREAIRLRPFSPGGYNNLGVTLAEQRRYEEAIEQYNAALAVAPDYAIAWNNLGNALRSVGRDSEALLALRRALLIKPDYPEALNNMAIAHVQLCSHDEALSCYNRALALKPDYGEAHMNRGLQYLLMGELEKGWSDYEWRWHAKTLRQRKLPATRWDGSPLVGKRILICYEQGLGDTFQFIRYAVDLKHRGATVIFEGQPAVQQILTRTPGIDSYVPRGQQLPAFDYYAPLLSLPGLFQTRRENVPVRIPYIFTEPKMIDAWRERLQTLKGFRIGIAWQGNPRHHGDRRRSARLEQFAGLAQIPGVRLVSLQKGFGSEQLQNLNGAFEVATFDEFDPQADGFLRTAAIMKNLDLVICVDTAVVHLGGAMGIPVWAMVSPACDWRWLQSREDSPWYPTVRLFRQKESGDWPELFGRVVIAVKDHLSHTVNSQKIATAEDIDRARNLHKDGIQAVAQSKFEQAEALLRESLQLNGQINAVHHDLGVVHAKQGRLDQAVACFRRAIKLAPDSAGAYGNLGLAYLQQDKIHEAIATFSTAIQLGGGTATVYNNLGVAYIHLPDANAAKSAYLKALHLQPDYADAHYNLARALLMNGAYEQGWIEYEWRWQSLHPKKREFRQPRWTGLPLNGRTILLYAEQGLGDTLQFIRFALIAKRMNGRVIVECQRAMIKLIEQCPFIDQVVAMGQELPLFDVQAPLMSLPSILRTTLDSIPSDMPYLSPEPETVVRWRPRVEAIGGFKIGIVWQGNPDNKNDRKRSVPLTAFAPIARIPGVKLVSLQSGYGSEQVASLNETFEVVAFDNTFPEEDGFLRSAAILCNLDLVITVDTAIAHLAGGLGIPVWIVLPTAVDWRWLEQREDSPWYPTARLFRQQQPGDWNALFAQVARCLEGYKGSRTVKSSASETTSISTETLHAEARRLLQADKLSAAGDMLERIVQTESTNAAALHDLGVIRARQRRLEEGVQHLQKALELRPNLQGAYGNLGLALIEKRDFAGAIVHLNEAIKRYPESTELHHRLGTALTELDRREEALRHFRTAVQLQPQSPELHFSLGALLRRCGNLDEAIESLRIATGSSNLREVHLLLGVSLAEKNEYQAAEGAFREAIRRQPEDVRAYMKLSDVLVSLNRVEEAAQIVQQAIYLRPDDPVLHQRLAQLLLRLGQFSQAWLECDWRLRDPSISRPRLPGRRWNGEKLEGSSILLVAEHDLTATIQFLRYASLVKKAGGRIIFACRREWQPFFTGCPAIDQIITFEGVAPAVEWHVYLMSLAAIFCTTPDTIPNDVPYLCAPEPGAHPYVGDRPFQVGIAFGTQGERLSEGSLLRKFMKLVQGRNDIQVINLSAFVSDAMAGISVDIISRSIADIHAMDLVLTEDSAIAHIAGAIAVRTWLFPSGHPEETWMFGSLNSVWYPSARLCSSMSEDTILADLESEWIHIAH